MGPSSGSVTVLPWSNPFASLAMGLEVLFKGSLFGGAGHAWVRTTFGWVWPNLDLRCETV